MIDVEVLCVKRKQPLKAPLCLVIMWAENIGFSHVAIKHSEFVSDSVTKFSRTLAEEEFLKTYVVVEKFKIKLPVTKSAFKEYIAYTDGLPYSIPQLLLIALRLSFKRLQRLMRFVVWDGQKALICTERVARLLSWAKVFEFEQSLDLISLKDVYKALYRIEKYGLKAQGWYSKVRREKIKHETI